MAEKVRMRIGSIARAVLVTGQAYQDPKDALNEFVSNAADEYAEMEVPGQRIQVVLKRRGRYPTIAVDDSGRGMSPDRLRELARNLFKSIKQGDDRTLGEKAIGLLAFQQIGRRVDIVSREAGSTETWCLALERGSAMANLSREKRRARTSPGTTIYLREVDREVLRMLTANKVVSYLRTRRGAAIEAGDYEIEVVEGTQCELVTPTEPDGIAVPLRIQETLWGPIEFRLYVGPRDGTARRVSIVGRAGTTVIDDITELEEFQQPPWTSGQVSGRIAFASLQQSAGRRAILRDDDAFPIFVEAVRSTEPTLLSVSEKVAAEMDQDTAGRVSEEIRKLFARVLKEMADLDNPMRAESGGGRVGADGIDAGDGAGMGGAGGRVGSPPPNNDDSAPTLGDMTRSGSGGAGGSGTGGADGSGDSGASGPTGSGARASRLPSIAPDPTPGRARSRFDEDGQVVLYNEGHGDYLAAKDSEADLVDYLATLVAKEYVLYNNPRSAPEDLAEEMVRMLLRVRRAQRRRR